MAQPLRRRQRSRCPASRSASPRRRGSTRGPGAGLLRRPRTASSPTTSRGRVGGQLIWLDRRDGAGRRSASRRAYVPQLSPDGRRLAFAHRATRATTSGSSELDRGVRTVRPRRQATPSPVWSAGRHRARSTCLGAGPRSTFRRAPANGAGERRVLYRQRERIEPTDWSRDGRFLLYDHGDRRRTADIWSSPSPDRARRSPWSPRRFSTRNAQFSPGRPLGRLRLERDGTRRDLRRRRSPAGRAVAGLGGGRQRARVERGREGALLTSRRDRTLHGGRRSTDRGPLRGPGTRSRSSGSTSRRPAHRPTAYDVAAPTDSVPRQQRGRRGRAAGRARRELARRSSAERRVEDRR